MPILQSSKKSPAEIASWVAREKSELSSQPIEKLAKLLYQCGQEVGYHDGEPEDERAYAVNLAAVKATAIQEIMNEQFSRRH